MKRREFLGCGVAAAGMSALVGRATASALSSRVRPGMQGWPSAADWAQLGSDVGGRLQPVTVPNLDDPAVSKLLSDPFYLQDQPGLSESSGWLDGWRSSPSAYMVAAQSAADVAAAVRFARARRLRLVVKGAGHSYIGASNAPDSLLIWTHQMDAITVQDAFVPRGCASAPVPAVSVGAGAIWLHAYKAVSVDAGRYVQGGGCTTVGVAGLVQGGGFGSFSKGFGTAAGSLLEAEIVTADGQVRIVNACREPDLYWALKGGGGGTFGVVTRLTLKTHDLPENFGAAIFIVQAHSDEAFRRLLARFLDHAAQNLVNPHWGEEVEVGPNNQLKVTMDFQGLTQDEARAAWKVFTDFVSAQADDYKVLLPLICVTFPARRFWDPDFMGKFPGAIARDSQPGAKPGDFWWAGAGDEAGAFWRGYASAWLPTALLRGDGQARLVDAWFEASRHWPVVFHFNKGLAGAPAEALAAARDSATNPDVLDAFALAIIASGGPQAFGGQPAPDMVSGRNEAAKVQAAMKALRVAAPHTGAYVNECDYFQSDWQRAFWGPHYPRLAAIKRRYDPEGLFFVHHGVGSEHWSADGFTRVS